jgi:hypothetical protein
MATALKTAAAFAPHLIPSQDRVEPGSVNIPVGEFPVTASTTSIAADIIAVELTNNFNHALATKDYHVISNLFLENGY